MVLKKRVASGRIILLGDKSNPKQAEETAAAAAAALSLKSARLEFYLFRKPLQATLHPVRVLDGVPVADTEQHLELRLGGRAPSAGTKISILPVLYVSTLHGRCMALQCMHMAGMRVSHVKCRHVGGGTGR
jgi:hypothetical protein